MIFTAAAPVPLTAGPSATVAVGARSGQPAMFFSSFFAKLSRRVVVVEGVDHLVDPEPVGGRAVVGEEQRALRRLGAD